ncbi:hypothetical protein L596_020982 [Steinernema carpocapsae]|uniref:Uncharacterized protein n=1 Tax=Steinernema carpocapsae TaxID=34508 RepID=A0A4U5MVS6_STECR|nr:hypothetical protein L596_020982 [Steinernema carpocapsae]
MGSHFFKSDWHVRKMMPMQIHIHMVMITKGTTRASVRIISEIFFYKKFTFQNSPCTALSSSIEVSISALSGKFRSVFTFAPPCLSERKALNKNTTFEIELCLPQKFIELSHILAVIWPRISMGFSKVKVSSRKLTH